jgi:predicted secreted protein
MSFLSVMFMLILAHDPVCAAEQRLFGVVTREGKNAAVGVRVSVWDGSRVHNAVSDLSGRFVIDGMPAGALFAVRFSWGCGCSARMNGLRFPVRGGLFVFADCGEVQNGAVYRVRVPSNPSTGYSWALAGLFPKEALAFCGKETEPACEPDTARPMVGLGGFESWFFRAERQGTATLLMTCSRPWEKGVSPLKYYICAIKVR